MNLCDPDNLTAFVDGILGEAERHRLAAHLETCPPCADTVRSHRAIKERLATSGALITVPVGLAERVSGALDRLPPPGHSLSGNGGAGSGGAGGLTRFGLPISVAALITAGGLWFARPHWQPQPVDVRALMWHHRDAIKPPAGASYRTTDAGDARRWVMKQWGKTSDAPDLPARLRGVGLCRVGDAPSVIWMYEDRGRPVSLIEVPKRERLPDWTTAPPRTTGGTDRHTRWRVGAYGGYNAVIWRDGERTYALVSDLPTARLVQLLERSP